MHINKIPMTTNATTKSSEGFISHAMSNKISMQSKPTLKIANIL